MIVTDVMSFVTKTVFPAAFVVDSDEEGSYGLGDPLAEYINCHFASTSLALFSSANLNHLSAQLKHPQHSR
jgi:hypothetical protein